MKRLWDLRQSANPGTLELYIYGDVESDGEDWWTGQTIRSETSAGHFRDELAKYPDAHDIHVYINSHGGSVFEGTAIYNQLRRHPAQVTVHIDGFACSIASVIAMAGDRVIMPRNAMMMIHNAYLYAVGNSAELRKAADDLDAINRGNWQAYLQKSGGKLSEEELCRMLDAETWLTAEDYVVIMTPGHQADYEVLAQALRTPAKYIGCIGSRKKIAATRERLLADGFSPAEIGRVHAPIGLPIGGETPAEVAVSVAAQLIACRSGRLEKEGNHAAD